MIILAAAVLASCGGGDAMDLVNPGGLLGGGGAGPTGTGGGGGGGTSDTIRCDWYSSYACTQVTASISAQQETIFASACAGSGGSFVADACDETKAVAGYCSWSGDPWSWGISGDWREYYWTPNWDAATAAAACATRYGGWVP